MFHSAKAAPARTRRRPRPLYQRKPRTKVALLVATAADSGCRNGTQTIFYKCLILVVCAVPTREEETAAGRCDGHEANGVLPPSPDSLLESRSRRDGGLPRKDLLQQY